MATRYRTPPSDLITYIDSLEKRLAKLERAPRAVATALDRGDFVVAQGSLLVQDGNGNTVIALGKNPATGNYTVQVIDPPTGNLVELHSLALQLGTASIGTVESTSSGTYTDLATVGPTVTVTIGNTGKAWVAVNAQMAGTAPNGGSMSFAVSGASSVIASDFNAFFAQMPGSGAFTIQASSLVLLTGLTPGVNTFTAKYRVNAGTASFADRTIIVQPY
jgi:hypothetical protein